MAPVDPIYQWHFLMISNYLISRAELNSCFISSNAFKFQFITTDYPIYSIKILTYTVGLSCLYALLFTLYISFLMSEMTEESIVFDSTHCTLISMCPLLCFNLALTSAGAMTSENGKNFFLNTLVLEQCCSDS